MHAEWTKLDIKLRSLRIFSGFNFGVPGLEHHLTLRNQNLDLPSIIHTLGPTSTQDQTKNALLLLHIVCVVESWLDDKIADSEICVQGYCLHRVNSNRHVEVAL